MTKLPPKVGDLVSLTHRVQTNQPLSLKMILKVNQDPESLRYSFSLFRLKPETNLNLKPIFQTPWMDLEHFYTFWQVVNSPEALEALQQRFLRLEAELKDIQLSG